MFKLSSAVQGVTPVTFNQLPRFGDQFLDDMNQEMPDEFVRKSVFSHAIQMREYKATFVVTAVIRAALITFFTNNKGGPVSVQYVDDAATQINTVMHIKDDQLEFKSVSDEPCKTYEITITFFKPTGGN